MSEEGRCPRCTVPGPVDTPCGADACVRLAVHRIPAAYVTRPSRDALVGQRVGAWLVLERIGAGGVGEVYLVEQRPVGLRAALKLITEGDTALAQPERFLREAAALARLTHPNIVRLLAHGMHHERPYLVMEYIEGARTLDRVAPHLRPSEKRRVVMQLTHAIGAAHAQGVVHRDLKPANVMLQAVVGEPHFVRVVDYGLAKFTDDPAHSTVVAGSPHYMAPEQVARDRIGPWTDIYALGALTLELFTGERPFAGPTVNAVLLLKSDPSYDPVEQARATLGAGLAGVLARAMARDPADRYPTIDAFRAAFAALPPMIDPPLQPTAPMRRSDAQIALATAPLGDVLDGVLDGALDGGADTAPLADDGPDTAPLAGDRPDTRRLDDAPPPPRRRWPAWLGWAALVAFIGWALARGWGGGEPPLPLAPPPDAAPRDAMADGMPTYMAHAVEDSMRDTMTDDGMAATADAMPADAAVARAPDAAARRDAAPAPPPKPKPTPPRPAPQPPTPDAGRPAGSLQMPPGFD